MAESRGTWKGGMRFEIEQDGHSIVLDASEDFGGSDAGPRPKGLLLSGLIGCTGMDVVSILRKMRVENFELRIKCSAELTDGYPSVFERIRLDYIFRGRDLPAESIEKAVRLSQEKYCGVSAMLRKAAPLDWRILYEES